MASSLFLSGLVKFSLLYNFSMVKYLQNAVMISEQGNGEIVHEQET